MRGFKTTNATAIWAVCAALVIGFAMGQLWHGGGASTSAAPGVASPEACPPEATPAGSPVPPPPVMAGQPVPYGENWTVVVTGLTTATDVSGHFPEGIYMVVDLTITNDTATARRFPFDELVLVDDTGRLFVIDAGISTVVPGSKGFSHGFLPNLPTDTAIVFDVAPDVGQTFTLESTADPAFRVQVDIEMRG